MAWEIAPADHYVWRARHYRAKVVADRDFVDPRQLFLSRRSSIPNAHASSPPVKLLFPLGSQNAVHREVDEVIVKPIAGEASG